MVTIRRKIEKEYFVPLKNHGVKVQEKSLIAALDQED
jgi:hypothetical protein